jgi:dTDP-4-dehydrorhamnose reductase
MVDQQGLARLRLSAGRSAWQDQFVRWLVTGSSGMLGADLCQVLIEHGEDVTGVGSADLDIREFEAVHAAVRQHRVIVNAAGWTAVDEADGNPLVM